MGIFELKAGQFETSQGPNQRKQILVNCDKPSPTRAKVGPIRTNQGQQIANKGQSGATEVSSSYSGQFETI